MDGRKQAELESSLELMSRCVRDKLDRVAIKLHLRDWQALTLDERRRLVDTPCESDQEARRYEALVEELVVRRTGKRPDRLDARTKSKSAEEAE